MANGILLFRFEHKAQNTHKRQPTNDKMPTRREEAVTAAEDEAREDEIIAELERLTAELRIIRERKKNRSKESKKKDSKDTKSPRPRKLKVGDLVEVLDDYGGWKGERGVVQKIGKTGTFVSELAMKNSYVIKKAVKNLKYIGPSCESPDYVPLRERRANAINVDEEK